MAGALFENFCIQEVVKSFANRGEIPRISYLRTNNSLEVDLIIDMEVLRPLPVEIKLTRTPTGSMASGLARYATLYANLNPKDGLILCSADGRRTVCRGVDAVGLVEFLELLSSGLNV
jgi:predicted AAA+ superfamily ATPase